MTTIGDNTMILKTIVNGSQKTEMIDYINDIHLLTTDSKVIRSMTIGKNLSCYGSIITVINNQNIMNYQHFAPGSYDFATPIVFNTFHLVKKPTVS
jgi:hypothetical protein